jgi:hypothetical protein
MNLSLTLAKVEHAPSIAALLQANSAAEGGTLYGDWSQAAVTRWIETGSPIVVALEGERLKGVLFSAEKADASAPPVVAMLRAWPGEADAYVYGPVCIDASMRGQQLLGKLVDELGHQTHARQGILFINRSNVGSLKAHQRLGMPTVAQFTVGDQVFDVLTTA